MTVNLVSSYMRCVLSPEGLRKNVDRVVAALTPWKDEFDCIAFRGMSGTLVASPVTYLMDKYPLMVRKADGNHSSRVVEGPDNLSRYVIVDDFICSGNTIAVIENMVKEHNQQANCVAICLYNGDNYYSSLIAYFRARPNLNWIQVGDLEERAVAFRDYVRYGGHTLSHDHVFGDFAGIPAVDICFPRAEDRQAVKSARAWADLRQLVERRMVEHLTQQNEQDREVLKLKYDYILRTRFYP